MEQRKDILLRAAFDILKRSREAKSTFARYHDADCDGYCLMEEIAAELKIKLNTKPIELQDQEY